MATEQAWFVFSFHEHDDYMMARYGKDSPPEQAFIQMLASEEWVRGRAGEPGDVEGYCTEGIVTLDAFEAHTREILTTEYWFGPEELRYIEFPFKKLRALVEADDWRFVGGYFMAFEGNHNDTEMRVVLERDVPISTSPKPQGGTNSR